MKMSAFNVCSKLWGRCCYYVCTLQLRKERDTMVLCIAQEHKVQLLELGFECRKSGSSGMHGLKDFRLIYLSYTRALGLAGRQTTGLLEHLFFLVGIIPCFSDPRDYAVWLNLKWSIYSMFMNLSLITNSVLFSKNAILWVPRIPKRLLVLLYVYTTLLS